MILILKIFKKKKKNLILFFSFRYCDDDVTTGAGAAQPEAHTVLPFGVAPGSH
jgi:hypothetical protein